MKQAQNSISPRFLQNSKIPDNFPTAVVIIICVVVLILIVVLAICITMRGEKEHKKEEQVKQYYNYQQQQMMGQQGMMQQSGMSPMGMNQQSQMIPMTPNQNFNQQPFDDGFSQTVVNQAEMGSQMDLGYGMDSEQISAFGTGQMVNPMDPYDGGMGYGDNSEYGFGGGAPGISEYGGGAGGMGMGMDVTKRAGQDDLNAMNYDSMVNMGANSMNNGQFAFGGGNAGFEF